MCRNACEWAYGRGENIFFCLYSPCVRAGVTQCALVMVVIMKCSTLRGLGGHFGVFDSQRHFPSYFSSSSLYWPRDPLSSLESTPVSIQVPKQVECNMCRFCKLLLFSFFFCKDGSDRLMKRASYSYCNFLCVVLAATYLKYRWCRLSCLPFVWHFFFIVTHTHTHTHVYKHWVRLLIKCGFCTRLYSKKKKVLRCGKQQATNLAHSICQGQGPSFRMG